MKIYAKIKYQENWCKVLNLNLATNTCDFVLPDNKTMQSYQMPEKKEELMLVVNEQ